MTAVNLPSPEAPESALTPDSRQAMRERLLKGIPWWYNPWLHLAIPSSFGLGVIAASIWAIEDLLPLQLITIPLVYLLSNATEWHAHRGLLHARHPLAPVLYDRHTPEHHMVYVTDDMAMRERNEFRLVLIPAYGIMAIFVATIPATAALWAMDLHNVAALFAATTMGYVVSYEWLHLSYHLGPDTFIGGLAPIRMLRQHHAVHHDPRLMQRWNFNVTVPVWDWVRGTSVKSHHQATQETT